VAVMGNLSSGYFQNLNDTAGISTRLLREKASSLFEEALTAGKLRRLTMFFCRCARRLLQLNQVIRDASAVNSHFAGTQTVEIEKIIGSESRVVEFDDVFNPIEQTTKSRWVSIAQAFLRGEALPPVDLIQVGDEYFVRDGHHRISVARQLGQRYIDAEITRIQIR
jgi:hypothetical protein